MKNEKFIYLQSAMEQMTTEQLDKLLHEELAKESPDGETVRQALKILEEREKDIPVEMMPEIRSAWEQYRKPAQPRRSPRRRGLVLKAASVAAALAVLVLALSQRTEAKSFFERLCGLTANFFQMISPGDDGVSSDTYIFQTDNPGLQEVYDRVTDMGITVPVVPMWLPEGYELVSCKVNKSEIYKHISAEFVKENSTITLNAYIYSANISNEYYKDRIQAESVEVAGRIHNVIQNEDLWISVWAKDNIECAIAVDCQEDTFYKILKSIYTMEGA